MAKSHPGKKKLYPEVVAEGNVVEHHDVVNAQAALYVELFNCETWTG
jgi:hypothetical protein